MAEDNLTRINKFLSEAGYCSRRAADNPDLIADDDLHPSGMMYRLWVEHFMLNVIEKLPQE